MKNIKIYLKIYYNSKGICNHFEVIKAIGIGPDIYKSTSCDYVGISDSYIQYTDNYLWINSRNPVAIYNIEKNIDKNTMEKYLKRWNSGDVEVIVANEHQVFIGDIRDAK